MSTLQIPAPYSVDTGGTTPVTNNFQSGQPQLSQAQLSTLAPPHTMNHVQSITPTPPPVTPNTNQNNHSYQQIQYNMLSQQQHQQQQQQSKLN